MSHVEVARSCRTHRNLVRAASLPKGTRRMTRDRVTTTTVRTAGAVIPNTARPLQRRGYSFHPPSYMNGLSRVRFCSHFSEIVQNDWSGQHIRKCVPLIRCWCKLVQTRGCYLHWFRLLFSDRGVKYGAYREAVDKRRQSHPGGAAGTTTTYTCHGARWRMAHSDPGRRNWLS